MTFDIAEEAPERTRYEVERLHELAVNKFGYATEHVLFTAHEDGTISGRIALYVAGDYDRPGEGRDHEQELDAEFEDTDKSDPDPPAVGTYVPSSAAKTTDDTAEAGA
ncbi:hypothetical protein [Haloglomus halophilum]|uniref:hypothetical protein n=1 Tax=Haloglomus halophilum TaxID=2962672 RepID=UPI0020C9461D|nr:hypothetical protein [Haloglomus halophilum]